MTEKKLNIHQRINAVMGKLTRVSKDAQMKSGPAYKFVSHDAVTEAIHPLLVEHGINAIPSVTSRSVDGNRTEVDINIDFVNIDEPDDKVSVQFFGYGIDPQDKGPGKAFSYAKKYAFLQVFCLGTGDDPEQDNIDHKPAEKKEKPNFTKELKDLNMTTKDVKDMLGKISAEMKACDTLEERQSMIDGEPDKTWESIINLGNRMYPNMMGNINKLKEGLKWRIS